MNSYQRTATVRTRSNHPVKHRQRTSREYLSRMTLERND